MAPNSLLHVSRYWDRRRASDLDMYVVVKEPLRNCGCTRVADLVFFKVELRTDGKTR